VQHGSEDDVQREEQRGDERTAIIDEAGVAQGFAAPGLIKCLGEVGRALGRGGVVREESE